MAFDLARGLVVLFGGFPNLGDTWEWDGNNWVQRLPAVSPSSRQGHAMAYDLSRSRVVLFGGSDAAGILSDTWEWDGTNWIQRAPAMSAPGRANPAMAYDMGRNLVVLFGGQGLAGNLFDTWDYSLRNPPAYRTFGIGCAGTAGTPELASVFGQLPWLGEKFTIVLTKLPRAAPALVFLGRSNSSWGAVRLPLPLDSLGMPGCTLFVSGEIAIPVVSFLGGVNLGLPIPNDPSVLGSSFFSQAFVMDQPANVFGATASNAGEGRIGAR
jgi:hypothetical protein